MKQYMPYNYIAHYFLQLVPETFIVILFSYAFSRKRIDVKFFISGLALSVISAVLIFGLTVNQIITQQIATILIFIASALILMMNCQVKCATSCRKT